MIIISQKAQKQKRSRTSEDSRSFFSPHRKTPNFSTIVNIGEGSQNLISIRQKKKNRKFVSAFHFQKNLTKNKQIKTKSAPKSQCYTARAPIESLKQQFYEKFENHKDREPIHSRKSQRFKIVSHYADFQNKFKSPLSQQCRLRTRQNFMKIKKQAICNFNEYSYNFIVKIQKQSSKHKNYPNSSFKNKEQTLIKYKHKNSKNKNFNIKSPEKKDFCRPWSRLQEDYDQIDNIH